MTIEQIKQEMIEQCLNLNDYAILIDSDGGIQQWRKEVAPNFARFAQQEDLILASEIFYENMMLEFKAETLEHEVADLWYELMTGGNV